MPIDIRFSPALETPAAMREEVERELSDFETWFATPLSGGGAGNSQLARPEQAILRTYLVARLSGRFVPPPR